MCREDAVLAMTRCWACQLRASERYDPKAAEEQTGQLLNGFRSSCAKVGFPLADKEDSSDTYSAKTTSTTASSHTSLSPSAVQDGSVVSEPQARPISSEDDVADDPNTKEVAFEAAAGEDAADVLDAEGAASRPAIGFGALMAMFAPLC